MPITGVGTVFRRWNTSTGEWDKLSEVRSISGPDRTRNILDSTTLDTVGGYRTFIAGFRDSGSIALTMNYSRESYDLMCTDFESDTLQNYEIVLNDTDKTSLEFEGLVTEAPLEIPEEIVTMNVTIKISGPVSIESGSGS